MLAQPIITGPGDAPFAMYCGKLSTPPPIIEPSISASIGKSQSSLVASVVLAVLSAVSVVAIRNPCTRAISLNVSSHPGGKCGRCGSPGNYSDEKRRLLLGLSKSTIVNDIQLP